MEINMSNYIMNLERYYNRYSIDWLIDELKCGKNYSYTTFWRADKGYENNIFSQWYYGKPIYINGRKYDTAEQYMMSEKALLFGDTKAYLKIISESDPAKNKRVARSCKPYNPVWNQVFREVIFRGNLGKACSDNDFYEALMGTGNSILVEASPYDDRYGAGMKKEDLLNTNGFLKVYPQEWHRSDSEKQAENNLGFVLMGLRDFLKDLRIISEMNTSKD